VNKEDSMNIRRQWHHFVLPLAVLVLLAACGKQPTPPPAPAPAPAPVATPAPAPVPPPAPVGVQVASIDLGTAAAPAQPGSTVPAVFASTDSIQAVVATTGTAAAATLAAKWTYQDGQTVNESTQTIAPTGPASTTFTIEKPDGWPAGKYTVEITLDGASAGKKDFEVR
jgi:hypothetical protein